MPARPVAKKLDMRRRGALAVSVLAVSVLAGAGLCLVGLVLAAAPRRPSRTALERRVEVHDARGDSKAALPVRRELLTLLRREGDGAAAARCLYALASDHRHLREFETAAALYREAAEAFEGQGDRDGQLDCRRMLGVIEYELDEPAKARETLLAALSWAGDRAGSCARARVLADLGNACYHLGRHDEAAGFYQQGLALEARPGHEAERAGTFNLLGRLLDQLGRLEEAERCYRSALELATRAGCALGRAGALRNLAGLEEKRGSPRRAIALCQQALSIYDELEHAAGRASALKHLGTLRAQAGDVQAAVNALQEALVGYRDLGDPAGLARCCASLGEVNERFGRREEAAACFLAAQEAFEAAAARGSRAEALAALAGSSVVRGEVEEGIRRHAAALDLWRAGGEARAEAKTLLDLAGACLEAGDPEAALARYREGLARYQEQGDARGVSLALGGIARAERTLGRRDEALEAAERAAGLAGKAGWTRAWAERSVEKAEVQSSMGRLEEATQTLAQVAVLAAAGDLPFLVSRAERKAARVARGRGAWEESERRYRGALEAIEKAGQSCTEDALEVRFFHEQQSFYEELIEHLLSRGEAEAALLASERSRARAFRRLAARRVEAAGDAEAPGFAGERKPEALDLGRPGRGSVLLVYHALEDRLVLWVVASDGAIEVKQVPVCRAAVAERAGRAVSLLRARREPVRAAGGGGSPARAELRALYDLLIAPAEDVLRREAAGAVCIVPHGPLFEVPFAALLDSQDRYLIETRAVSFALCVGHAVGRTAHSPRPVAPSGPFLLVGDPVPPGGSSPFLPGAREEVEGVARIARVGPGAAAPAVLLGPGASEEAFRRLAPESRWVHLAAHAIAREDGRWSPALLLARTGSEPERDGRLTAPEVQALKLSADLVVLSACDSGRGEVVSDGVLGLPRSFLAAGARSVIATLWKVDDRSTRDLVLAFYGGLLQGLAKPEALRRAQLQLLESEGEALSGPETQVAAAFVAARGAPSPAPAQVSPRSPAHPQAWAGFVLYGAGE